MSNPPAKILIVDDEERVNRLLKDFLDDFDEFETHAVSSAEEALAELSRTPYDLCIVDIRLPGMNGHDFVLESLRRKLCNRFLLHTGSIDYSLPEQLSCQGLTDKEVLYKPCDMHILLERIHEMLHKDRGMKWLS